MSLKTSTNSYTISTDSPLFDVVFSGYLLKRNPTGAWQKRFCVATRNKFIYYKHKARVEKGLPQGTVSLVGSTCTLPEAGDINCLKRENCFVLKSSNKEYYLSCESKKDFQEWTKTLGDCVGNIKAGYAIHPHSFKKVHFSKAPACAKCNTPIHGLGKQGFMCQVCTACVHKKCAFKLEEDCSRTTSPALKAVRKDSKDAKELGTLSKDLSKKGLMERFRNTFTTTIAHQYAALDLPQLQVVLVQTEEAEHKELQAVTTKFDSQAREIMDEIIYRYLKEVEATENEYKKKKAELQEEIQVRQQQKQS